MGNKIDIFIDDFDFEWFGWQVGKIESVIDEGLNKRVRVKFAYKRNSNCMKMDLRFVAGSRMIARFGYFTGKAEV